MEVIDEFVRIVAISQSGESQESFSARLSEFWTHMLRDFKADFENVYAEKIEFELDQRRFQRDYLCREEVVALVLREMKSAQVDYLPVDTDDRWNKYEAVASEWMQIEH